MSVPPIRTEPRVSATFDRYTISEIQRAAATGIYDIRGGGAKRKLPNFDDLLFLGASISRYPLEGYREKCGTDLVLGSRFARKPIHLKTPVTIAGMSFGALSAQAKEALGRGASAVGTSPTTGDGGMTAEERGHSSLLVSGWQRCEPCRKESTSAPRPGIRTGPVRTISKSRSKS